MKLLFTVASALPLCLLFSASAAAKPQPQIEVSGIRPPLKPKSLVTSQGLQSSVSSKNLLKHAGKLLEFSELSNSTRAFGSRGHNATIEYIKQLLDNTGYYDTYLQTFTYPYSQVQAQLSIDGIVFPAKGPGHGPSGKVNAAVVVVANLGCQSSDFPADVAGKIALIKRGECTSGTKVALAGAAGAAAVILYNNVDADYPNSTLGAPERPEGPYVPVVAVSGSNGTAIVSAAAAGKTVTGNLQTDALNEVRYTPNLIATTKQGDKKDIVFAGAHSDSVPAGPGINDDGSGTISILDIALALPKYSVKNAVRFGWWTAEEFGLVGSEYYIEHLSEKERQKVALYLNFDMLASPNSGYFVHDGDGSSTGAPGPDGSGHIEQTFLDYFDAKNLTTAASGFTGSSDYDPFVNIGIPSGGLLTGAAGIKNAQGQEWWGGEAGVAYDKCYHARCDTIDNLRIEVWVENTKAAAHAIATYARSVDGIPRAPRAPVARLRISELSYEERIHAVCGKHNDEL